jgi:hypothetical protein
LEAAGCSQCCPSASPEPFLHSLACSPICMFPNWLLDWLFV